jgi:hypothetical protein
MPVPATYCAQLSAGCPVSCASDCGLSGAVPAVLCCAAAAASPQLPPLPRVVPPGLPVQVVQVFWQVKLRALPEPVVIGLGL